MVGKILDTEAQEYSKQRRSDPTKPLIQQTPSNSI